MTNVRAIPFIVLCIIATPLVAQVEPDPTILPVVAQVKTILKDINDAAAAGTTSEWTPELFDELERKWATARPRVAEVSPDRVGPLDQRIAFLRWWNRTLVWCLDCDVEGREQNQQIVTREELRARFSSIPQGLLDELKAAAGDDCGAARVLPVPETSMSVSCHAGIGSDLTPIPAHS